MNAIALIWGFAEATLFFIVPDVWLTLAGRDKLHRGLIVCLYSLAGALTGGTLMYLWGSQDHQKDVDDPFYRGVFVPADRCRELPTLRQMNHRETARVLLVDR